MAASIAKAKAVYDKARQAYLSAKDHAVAADYFPAERQEMDNCVSAAEELFGNRQYVEAGAQYDRATAILQAALEAEKAAAAFDAARRGFTAVGDQAAAQGNLPEDAPDIEREIAAAEQLAAQGRYSQGAAEYDKATEMLKAAVEEVRTAKARDTARAAYYALRNSPETLQVRLYLPDEVAVLDREADGAKTAADCDAASGRLRHLVPRAVEEKGQRPMGPQARFRRRAQGRQ